MHKKLSHHSEGILLWKRRTCAFLNTIFTIIALIWICIVKFRAVREASLVKIPRSPSPNETDTSMLLRMYAVEVDYWLTVSAAFSLVYCLTDLVLALLLMHNVTRKENHRHYLTWLMVVQGALLFLTVMDTMIYLVIGKINKDQRTSFTFLVFYMIWKAVLLSQFRTKAKRSSLPPTPSPSFTPHNIEIEKVSNSTMTTATITTPTPAPTPVDSQSQFSQPKKLSAERRTATHSQIVRETSFLPGKTTINNDLINFDSAALTAETSQQPAEEKTEIISTEPWTEIQPTVFDKTEEKETEKIIQSEPEKLTVNDNERITETMQVATETSVAEKVNDHLMNIDREASRAADEASQPAEVNQAVVTSPEAENNKIDTMSTDPETKIEQSLIHTNEKKQTERMPESVPS